MGVAPWPHSLGKELESGCTTSATSVGDEEEKRISTGQRRQHEETNDGGTKWTFGVYAQPCNCAANRAVLRYLRGTARSRRGRACRSTRNGRRRAGSSLAAAPEAPPGAPRFHVDSSQATLKITNMTHMVTALAHMVPASALVHRIAALSHVFATSARTVATLPHMMATSAHTVSTSGRRLSADGFLSWPTWSRTANMDVDNVDLWRSWSRLRRTWSRFSRTVSQPPNTTARLCRTRSQPTPDGRRWTVDASARFCTSAGR